jgi:hypothetical protein
MYRQPVRNIGPIDLVLSPNALLKLLEKKRRHPHLPEPLQIKADLQELGRQGGVPAVITVHKGKEMLFLYTSSYYLATYPTTQGDGYTVSYVEPLDLHEHERLGRGALILQTPYWEIYSELRQLPRRSNHWHTLQNQWRYLEAQRRQVSTQTVQELETLTPAHENYLNAISTLVEVTRRLEQDKHKLPTLIPYRHVESAGEERYARDIYTFILFELVQLNDKHMLRLKEVPDLQGRVLSYKEKKLTVKFEGTIDRARIPNQGNFEPVVNAAVYRSQQEAIETLREGEAKNKHMLHVLVDRNYLRYQPDNAALPNESLNSEQLEAFRRALTVPDLLLVLGPPGTGKTRTITEIVRQCSVRHQRVLVTSGTHKAVDNVLERLPANLMVIRFGHEDRIAESTRHLLIDEQAKRRQQHISQQTEVNQRKLANFDQSKSTIDQWVKHLTTLIAWLSKSEQRMNDTLQRSMHAAQRIAAPYKPRIDELATALQHQADDLMSHRRKLDTWKERQTIAESRRQQPLIGLFFQWSKNFYQNRVEKEQVLANEAKRVYEATNQEFTNIQNKVQCAFATDPEYQLCDASRRQIEDRVARIQKEASSVVNTLQGNIQGLLLIPALVEPLTTRTLQHYATWFDEARCLLEKRAKLLQDWRNELESRTEQLIPELLRYADVVGATCIGAATAKGLADIEFDLAIVDEAGQICLPDLLVPLVRAKRSVLVGDHNQLPPFVDSNVQTWLDSLSSQTQLELSLTDEEADSERITELLTKSAFEQLFIDRADPAHVVRFTEQRRMPQVISDFASHHFYNNQLRTCSEDQYIYAHLRDPLFLRPLAFVDTSSLPFDQRKEEKKEASESWGIVGFANRAEARLIARIAALYEQEGMDWVIIVPYRAQAHLITQQLSNRIEAGTFKLEERIATVDSFQGGERDKVIYGFTRSNKYGGIGFLKELRRLNVAITRARQQLVLVGDLSTLTQAEDMDFRNLAESLQAYTQQRGELLSYKECQNRLPISN